MPTHRRGSTADVHGINPHHFMVFANHQFLGTIARILPSSIAPTQRVFQSRRAAAGRKTPQLCPQKIEFRWKSQKSKISRGSSTVLASRR
jgi:hypothetical protein